MATGRGTALLLLVPLFIASIAYVAGSRDLQVQCNALAVLVVASLVVRIDRRLMPDWIIGPGTFFCLHHVAAYSVSPLGQLWFFGEVKRSVDLDGFIMAQQGAIIGLATWVLIYPSVFKAIFKAVAAKTKGRSSDTRFKSSWESYGIALLFLGILILAYQVAVGLSRIGAQGANVEAGQASVYSAFSLTPVVALCFLAHSAARRGGSHTGLWLVSFLTFVLWNCLDGGRAGMIMAGVSSACGLCYGGVGRKKLVYGGLLAAFLFVPIFGLVRGYRDTYSGNAGSLSERTANFLNALAAYRSGITSVAQASQDFLARISPDPVDSVFLMTPGVFPYAGFSEVDAIKYVYAPGFLFGDRPDLIDGNRLCIEYGTARSGSVGNSMSVVADGYRRFSWPGIAILYSIIASCCAVLVACAWNLRDRPEWIATMLVLLLSLTGESTLATLLSTLYFVLWTFPKYFLYFWAISFVLRSRGASIRVLKRLPIRGRLATGGDCINGRPY